MFDFRTLFFHKLVVPSPLIHTLKYLHNLLRFHRVIGLLKKYEDSKISVFYTRIFLNLRLLKHRDWKI